MQSPIDSARQPRRAAPVTRRLDVAGSLTTGRLYRPGALLAAVMILFPVGLALAGAAATLAIVGSVPLLVPLIFLLCIPALLLAWRSAVTVRTTATYIAARRPGRPWQEVPWALVDRAERRGLSLVLRTSDGRHIAFMPLCLQGGHRLYRDMLMRLSVRVLDDRLRAHLKKVLGEQVVPGHDGGLSGRLYARPRAVWHWSVASIALAALALGGAAVWYRPPVAALPLAGCCLVTVCEAGVAFVWLKQELIISEHGISILHAMGKRSYDLTWGEIQLIEHTPGERILRIWGKQRTRCAGPTLLTAPKRDLMRAFLHEYCLARGVPVVERKWLW